MEYLLQRQSMFCDEGFEPSQDLNEQFLECVNILVVGAGGLGCEILKNLGLLGVKNITVIDLDTIELTNLNRQFLFRQKDIGKYKAQVAADFIKRKYPEIDIKWEVKKVQDFPINFFSDFQIVIGGLDNIEARSYLNKICHSFIVYKSNGEIDPDYPAPIYVDGGTEGFRGQSQVVHPVSHIGACYECTANMRAKNNKIALCTLASTPRNADHCALYIKEIVWGEHHQKPIDTDSTEDVQWIYEKALERAKEFRIDGVTLQQTLGAIKNVIPAIPSTNAIIAASTVLESVKALCKCSIGLKYYMMYMGHEGLNTEVLNNAKNPDCFVCHKPFFFQVDGSMTLQDFLDFLKREKGLSNPSIQHQNNTYVFSNADQDLHKHRLTKTLKQLVDERELVIATGDGQVSLLRVIDVNISSPYKHLIITLK